MKYPSITISVPVMDRADHIQETLPIWLNQDYPDFSIVLIDRGSQDGLERVLEPHQCANLLHIRTPRPEYYDGPHCRNMGIRYSFSDYILQLNADAIFPDSGYLKRVFDTMMALSKYPLFSGGLKHIEPQYEYDLPGGVPFDFSEYCMTNVHGGIILAPRVAMMSVGGYWEGVMEGWGYYDTDFIVRMGMCGLKANELECENVNDVPHSDEKRQRLLKLKLTNKDQSWCKNRDLATSLAAEVGVVANAGEKPGYCNDLWINGSLFEGGSAPQQNWTP